MSNHRNVFGLGSPVAVQVIVMPSPKDLRTSSSSGMMEMLWHAVCCRWCWNPCDLFFVLECVCFCCTNFVHHAKLKHTKRKPKICRKKRKRKTKTEDWNNKEDMGRKVGNLSFFFSIRKTALVLIYRSKTMRGERDRKRSDRELCFVEFDWFIRELDPLPKGSDQNFFFFHLLL